MGISLLVGIIILVFAGKKYLRDEEVGMLSYGAAMKSQLLASLIGMLMSQVFAIAKFNNDSDMKTLFKEYTIELTESMMRMTMGLTGADESQIEDIVAKAKEELEENVDKSYPFSWAKIPMNLINIVIISLILALISAIFVREKETTYS